MRVPRLFLLVLVAVLSAAFARAWLDTPGFPHRKHAKLFPTGCLGCHAGIPTESRDDRFPSRASCAECHDGKEQKPVAWTGYVAPPTNLRFSHVAHAREARRDSSALGCQSCHRDLGADASPMSVTRAVPDNCLSCHEHTAPEHLADASKCRTCHVPLVQAAALDDSAIAAFPKPPSHARPDFVSTHGATLDATSNCATCHARESCARCHPNADAVARTARLAPDPRVARMVRALAPVYPTPASHRAPDWWETHGPAVKRDAGSCANCHTQASCNACHAPPHAVAARPVAARPAAAPARIDTTPRAAAPGATVRRTTVHPPDFATTHGPSAGSARLNCLGCHQQKQCTDCHDGNTRRRFHAVNYMSRHAADSYGEERGCTTCHNAETFCRSCHVGNGMAARGGGNGVGVAAHNRQPLWLLQHGQAARQGLEGCTTCHQQRDCLRCHSDLGRRVNPHGRDFDASRFAARNRQTCMVCHLTDPLKGR